MTLGTDPPPAAAERRRAFLGPYDELLERVRHAKEIDVYALFPALDAAGERGWALLDGTPVVSLVANDYLGLGRDPRVAEAAAGALTRLGTSRCASPLAGGYTELTRTLEDRLAAFTGQEAAVVLASGYQANLGAIGGLTQPGDLVVCDLLSHASIVDGARLAGAEVRYFRHNDAGHLDSVLGAVAGGRRTLVAVEGVYSADGDTAPLPEICAVAHRHGALVLLDEAHSLGVFGPDGAGLAAHHGLSGQVDLVVGTMSKSLGMVGGFVAGDRRIVDVVRHAGRALIFSAALPPAMAGGALRSLELLRSEPERRQRLWDGTRRLLSGLRERGFDTLGSVTPVVPVLVGDPVRTLHFAAELSRSGVLVCPAVPPMVQPHRSRIRMHVTADHDAPALEHTLRVLDEVGRRTGVPRAAEVGTP